MMKVFVSLLLLLVHFELYGQVEVNKSELHGQHVIEGSAMISSKMNGMGIRYKKMMPISSVLSWGLGIGFDSYDRNFGKGFIPITAEVTSTLKERGIMPFYHLSAGYGFALPVESSFAESARGGYLLDVGIGIKNNDLPTQPFLKVSYRRQQAFYNGTDVYGNTDKNVIFNRLNITFGVYFND